MVTLEEIMKIKGADTEADLHPFLFERYSPRAFSDAAVDKDSLNRMFEAARWSASCANEQPWRFIVGIKGEGDAWDRILSVLDEGNHEWCQYAPILMITVYSREFHAKQVANAYAPYDLGQSMVHFTLQGMSEGVYVHQMAGFFPEKAKEAFNIPDDYQAFTCVAIGYPGIPDKLSEKNYKQETSPRKRRPLEETVFSEDWNKPLQF